MHSYYKTLELPNFASAHDIKSAYRRLAKRYHPDVNGGDRRLEELFKQVQHAYDVLSDPYKRASYDAALRQALNGPAHATTYSTSTHTQRPAYQQPVYQAPVYTSANYKADRKFRKQALKVLIGLSIFLALMMYFFGQNPPSEKDRVTMKIYSAGGETTITEVITEALKNKNTGYQPPAVAFKLGDNTEAVLAAQGESNLIWESGNRQVTWKYGASSVTFIDGKVWEYTNLGPALSFAYTDYDPNPAPASYFGTGSSRSVVLQLQGSPITVRKMDVSGGEIWIYAGSAVYFLNDQVVNYANNDGSLRVNM